MTTQIFTPGHSLLQPQFQTSLDFSRAKGLVGCVMPWYSGEYVKRKPADALPAIIPTRYGLAYDLLTSGTASSPGIRLSSNSKISIPANSDFTILVAVSNAIAYSSGSNHGVFRSGSNQQGSDWWSINKSTRRNSFTLGGSAVISGTGAQVTVGSDIVLALRMMNASQADIWWDGVQQTSASTSVAVPAFDIYYVGSQWVTGEVIGNVSGFWVWNRALHNGELREFTRNPWQLFEETSTSYVFIPGTSSSHDLSISNLTQSNTVSEPSISQVHVLDFFDPTFFNTLSSPSVTQNHVLDVFDPTFFNTLSEPSISLNGEIALDISDLVTSNSISSVSIEVSRTLSIGNLTQANSLSQASISQVHVLDVFDPTFFNLISNVEVDLAEGIVHLTVNSLTQTNTLSQSSVLIPPNNNTLVSKHIVPV